MKNPTSARKKCKSCTLSKKTWKKSNRSQEFTSSFFLTLSPSPSLFPCLICDTFKLLNFPFLSLSLSLSLSFHCGEMDRSTIAASAVPSGTGHVWKDSLNGAILQMVEAATLGMPFEVWKTHMGRFRNETTLQALRSIYTRAGGGANGVLAFWKGLSPKMLESASKGAVLMVSKEHIKTVSLQLGMGAGTAGLLAGAGGGVCQVAVMGPCTFLVTCVVTGDKNTPLSQHINNAWHKNGIKGFYPGGVAIAWRQATNWASRQGFTDFAREMLRKQNDDPKAKLSMAQEVTAGIIGGTLSVWNQPFEVARIEAQARAGAGQTSIGMVQIFKMVVHEHGVAGLFKGVIPRIGLAVWQTLFMVTGANLIRERFF